MARIGAKYVNALSAAKNDEDLKRVRGALIQEFRAGAGQTATVDGVQPMETPR